MKHESNTLNRQSTVLTVLAFGALWGIFEATVGYCLHLLPAVPGWLIWYPMACAFMGAAYLKTKRESAILSVALISALIKLLNLLMPVRIDRVINPAVSILFEAIAMIAAVIVMCRLSQDKRKGALLKGAAVLGMNTTWRLLYIAYIGFLVPQWMRDISVLSSQQQLIRFLVIENLLTTAIVLLVYLAAYLIRAYLHSMKRYCANCAPQLLRPRSRVLDTIGVCVLIFIAVSLQLIL